MTIDEIKTKITEIDAMFESATGWGSWMASASAYRRSLVIQARHHGVIIENKHECRTSSGALSD